MDIVGRELDHEANTLADLDELARAVDETQVLLRYAGQAGIEVQADAVSALMHAKICVEARRVPADVAVEFYAAYARLAARVAPVTIDTLRVSEETTRVRLRQYRDILGEPRHHRGDFLGADIRDDVDDEGHRGWHRPWQ